MKLDELREHCLKTLKQTKKFPTKTFEEHALVLQLIENQESIISELESLKQEITNIQIETCTIPKTAKDIQYEALWILDNYISKLKGDNNE